MNFTGTYNLLPLIERCEGLPWVPVLVAALYTAFVRRYGTPGLHSLWVQMQVDPEDLAFTFRAWNMGLCAFALWGVYQTHPYLLHLFDWLESCEPPPLSGEEGRAMAAFTMSKFVELGDTLFLVLRGRNVRFIHSFHHASVLLLTWYLFVTKASIGPVFVAMNYLVHVLLYLYYVAMSLPWTVAAAKQCAPVVTMAQILQMVVGLFVSLNTLRIKVQDAQTCHTSVQGALFATTVYGIYLVLFGNLWVQLYGKKLSKQE